MSTASLELCRELYDLSGWGDTHWNWFTEDSGKKSLSHDAALFGYGVPSKFGSIYTYPAYDLGYLWRKFEELGNDLNVGYHDSSCDMTFAFGARGTGSLLDGFGMRFNVEPQEEIEDYFCQFFIDMFKNNHLSREEAYGR